mmetsp:Transcript_8721/g.16929  ORF Transcript_8721/g.16929 Transcript_8721/m.16929 type:complete len:108 (-) Transcript_8721:864-1187(-)
MRMRSHRSLLLVRFSSAVLQLHIAAIDVPHQAILAAVSLLTSFTLESPISFGVGLLVLLLVSLRTKLFGTEGARERSVIRMNAHVDLVTKDKKQNRRSNQYAGESQT